MNFDKYIKQSIVSAIMQELPRVDTDALKKEVQAKLVAAMSPECQAVYAKTPNALSYRHASRIIDGYHGVNFVAGDVTEEQFEAIMKPYQNVYDERASIRSKLEAAINGIRTRKQFIDRFPEFSQHAPAEDGTCATLPAIANIVADLVKLGWEPKVTKTEGEPA